jgi:hypothetical protein
MWNRVSIAPHTATGEGEPEERQQGGQAEGCEGQKTPQAEKEMNHLTDDPATIEELRLMVGDDPKMLEYVRWLKEFFPGASDVSLILKIGFTAGVLPTGNGIKPMKLAERVTPKRRKKQKRESES